MYSLKFDIFLKCLHFVSLKSFRNSRSNSYVHSLRMITSSGALSQTILKFINQLINHIIINESSILTLITGNQHIYNCFTFLSYTKKQGEKITIQLQLNPKNSKIIFIEKEVCLEIGGQFSHSLNKTRELTLKTFCKMVM